MGHLELALTLPEQRHVQDELLFLAKVSWNTLWETVLRLDTRLT
jgi:hypothetical protein